MFLRYKRIFAVLLTVFLFTSLLYCQSGGLPGSFLNLSSGARSIGMGGTSIGLVDDATSVFINPGMLGTLYDVQFNATLCKFQFDRNYYDLSLAYPLGALGNFGMGWTQFSIDDIVGRDQDGYTTHTFSDVQSAFVFGYSRMIGDRFSMGVSAKYIQHTLAGYSAKGATFDFGTAFFLGDFVTIGGVVQNISSSLKWNTNSGLEEKLPMAIGLGVSYFDPFGIPNITLSSDVNLVGGEFAGYNLGAEYVFKDLVIARGGYFENGLTFGAGVMYGGLKLDFAYSPETFGNASRLHFTFNWVISPAEVVYEAPEQYPEEPTPAVPEPEREEVKEKRSIVLIVDGPLKFEKAEVLKTNVVDNTITVRLLALPDSDPVVLRLDQVEFVK